MRQFTAGDRVAYAAKFCRQMGGGFAMASRRGTVVGVHPTLRSGIAVEWDDEPGSAENSLPVHPDNLARVGSVAFCDRHASK